MIEVNKRLFCLSDAELTSMKSAFYDIDRALKISARVMTETTNSDSASNLEIISQLSFKNCDIPAFISQNGKYVDKREILNVKKDLATPS